MARGTKSQKQSNATVLSLEAKLWQTADALRNGVIQPVLVRISGPYFENRALAALRDALLPKLISGELRVRDAERWAEQAVA